MSARLTRRGFLAATTAGVAISATTRSQEVAETLTLAENGRSEYTIVRPVGASPSQVYASEELHGFLKQMTGAELPILTDDRPLPEKAIVLGDTAHTAALLGGAPDLVALGDDGFLLRTVGEHLCIVGSPVRGTLYGVYELLERYCGCRWYATFHSVVPSHPVLRIPALDDTQVPAFAMREPFWWELRQGDNAARNRVNGSTVDLEERHGGKVRFGGGLFVHTFYRLVPPSEFFEEHPEYFSLIDGERQIGYSQLCLTNPDVVRLVTERVLAAIREDPGAKLYSVSQNDWDGRCQCDACREIEEREEAASGPLIHFVNQVAEAVEKEFPDVWIETLAYQHTRKPPKTLRPRHNVVPRLCTIECEFAQPLDESPFPQNRSFVEDIRGWSAMTDKLYVWDYVTNFHHYVGPHPNFPVLAPNIRFFRENRVVGLFEQGACQGAHAEFGELRGWLIAKLLWNPDQPVEPLLDDFFQGYYGAAAGPIREYFDELQTLPTKAGATLRIYDSMRNPWLTMDFVERGERLWAEAERLAADDPGLLYRVRMGGLTVLWARLELMGGPDRVYVLAGDRLVHRHVDPLYRHAAEELLRRVEEGGVRVREWDGYHAQEIVNLKGHVEGFEVESARAGEWILGAAPRLAGGAVVWARDGGPNLLSPELGGIEFTNRHEDLDRPDFAEFELVGVEGGSIAIRGARPRAVWGPQTRERLKAERTLRVSADGLEIGNIYRMERQARAIHPALRAGLAMTGPVRVRAGEWQAELPGPGTAADLPPEALASATIDFLPADGSAGVRLTLPQEPPTSASVLLAEAGEGVLFMATFAERRLEPGEAHTLTIRACVIG